MGSTKHLLPSNANRETLQLLNNLQHTIHPLWIMSDIGLCHPHTHGLLYQHISVIHICWPYKRMKWLSILWTTCYALSCSKTWFTQACHLILLWIVDPTERIPVFVMWCSYNVINLVMPVLLWAWVPVWFARPFGSSHQGSLHGWAAYRSHVTIKQTADYPWPYQTTCRLSFILLSNLQTILDLTEQSTDDPWPYRTAFIILDHIQRAADILSHFTYHSN